MAYLRHKITGERIDRTLETMQSTYEVVDPYIGQDGVLYFETGCYRDFIETCSQVVMPNGDRVFLDKHGEQVMESDLELVEEEE